MKHIYSYILLEKQSRQTTSFKMSSISQIVSDASSNISLYDSFEDKNIYYDKCLDPSIIITSQVKDSLDEILSIDTKIMQLYQMIKDIDKIIKELKEFLSSPYISLIEFMVNSYYIKLQREERRTYFDLINKYNQTKSELYKEIQHTDFEMVISPFNTNFTIMESNKVRAILRKDKKKLYLINMSSESRNKKKNTREMNKLLFGKDNTSNKHNKIRKTKSPNNNKYN